MTVAPGPTLESVKWTSSGVRIAGTLALTKARSGPSVMFTHASRAGSSPLFANATVAATMSAGVAFVRVIDTVPVATNGSRTTTDHEAVRGGNSPPFAFV